MRHRVSHRKLGRTTEHRVAMLRNQAEALLRHERLETTVPRAKELRHFVERLITLAKRGVAAGEGPRAVHARRLVRCDIADGDIVSKLFSTIAPRFSTRAGGYTRLLRIGFRRGDSAELAQVELVGSEYRPEAPERAEKQQEAPPTGKRVGERLKAAARRLRGQKGEQPGGEEPENSDVPSGPRGGRSKATARQAQKKRR